MTSEQASALRVAIHRLVRAERELALVYQGAGSRTQVRRLMVDVSKLINEATIKEKTK